MLQKIKYETLNFGRYEKLRKKFQSADFEPDELKELELTNQRATELPSINIFSLIKHLQVLILSNNCICRFDASIITKSVPQLELIDLSNNQIDIIDDLIELGSLKSLQFLEFSNNPICGYMIRIKMLKHLLYPDKYKKYDPVVILTADYHAVPNPRLSPKEAAQQKLDDAIIEKFPEELDTEECRVKVSKYNHKNTLAKYAAEICPVPRKSRFPNLKFLNGEFISKYDVMRASGQRNIAKILYDAKEQDELRREQEVKRKVKESMKKSEAGEMHLANYKKKIAKLLQSNQEHAKVQKIDNEDDLAYLARLDQADFKNQKKNAINQKKFAQDIWEVPQDVIYKDAEFNISIKNYKKMLQEYDAEKAKKLTQAKERQHKKQLQNRTAVLKKLEQDGFGAGDAKEFASGQSDGLDSDIEVRKLFKKKKEKRKPKLNLEQNDVDDYRSSQSSQSESIHLENQSSMSEDENNNNYNLSSLKGGHPAGVVAADAAADYSGDNNHLEQQQEQQYNIGQEEMDEIENFKPNSTLKIKIQSNISNNNNKENGSAIAANANQNNNKVDVLELRKQMQQSEKDKEKQLKSRKSTFIASIATGGGGQSLAQKKSSNSQNQQQQSQQQSDDQYSKQTNNLNVKNPTEQEEDDYYQDGSSKQKFTKETLSTENNNNNSLQQQNNYQQQQQQNFNNLITIKTEESADALIFHHQQQQQQQQQGQDPQQKSIYSQLQNPAMAQIQQSILQSNNNHVTAHPYDLTGTPYQHVLEQQLTTLPVKDFNFDHKFLKPGTQPLTQSIKQQNDQSFKISNKIFYSHHPLNGSNNNQGGNSSSQIGLKQKHHHLKNKSSKNLSATTANYFTNSKSNNQLETTQKIMQNTLQTEGSIYINNNSNAAAQQQDEHKPVLNHRILSSQSINVKKMQQDHKKRVAAMTMNSTNHNNNQNGAGVGGGQNGPSANQDYLQLQGNMKPKNHVIEKSRVFLKGDLNTTDFLKSDVPIENLLPLENHGVPQKFLITYLHDPKNDTHQQIKYYKKIIDNANNLILGHKELDRKLEIVSIKKNKEPTQDIPDAISFNKIIEYLGTDKNFCLQNSYDPAENTIYQVTRGNKRPPSSADAYQQQQQQQNQQKQQQLQMQQQQQQQQQHQLNTHIYGGNAKNASTSTLNATSHNNKDVKEKLSTYDLREIIYRANNYDSQQEPKITEKDVLEKLSDKNLGLEEKMKYYDWLALLDEIKLRKNRGNEASLNRLEKKEIERAENNAHLKYHYERLRKYVPEEIIDGHLLQLGIRPENKGAIKYKSSVKKKLLQDQHPQGDHNSDNNNNGDSMPYSQFSSQKNTHRQHLRSVADKQQEEAEQAVNNNVLNKAAELLQQKQKGKEKQKGFFSTIESLMQMKAEQKPMPQKEEIQLTGTILEDIPNINEIINKRHFKPPQMLSFEEMVDQNLRKIQGQYQKSQAGMLSLEEQMMRQAQEFKNKVQEREKLKQNIELYIQENQKKLNEFQEWDENEHDKRHDKDYCFKTYVKMVREKK